MLDVSRCLLGSRPRILHSKTLQVCPCLEPFISAVHSWHIGHAYSGITSRSRGLSWRIKDESNRRLYDAPKAAQALHCSKWLRPYCVVARRAVAGLKSKERLVDTWQLMQATHLAVGQGTYQSGVPTGGRTPACSMTSACGLTPMTYLGINYLGMSTAAACLLWTGMAG